MKPKDAFIGYPKTGNAARRVGPSAFPLMAVTANVRSWLRVLKKSEPTDFVQLSFL